MMLIEIETAVQTLPLPVLLLSAWSSASQRDPLNLPHGGNYLYPYSRRDSRATVNIELCDCAALSIACNSYYLRRTI